MAKIITRRDFMRKTTCVVAGTAIGVPSQQKKKSRVILIRNKDVVNKSQGLNAEIVQRMLDEAVMKLFEKDDPVATFKGFITADDIIGIKTNEWAYLPTPNELEQAIKKRVIDAGADSKNIGIKDRNLTRDAIFQKATVLINVRPLRTHYLSGMSGCMKNYVTFVDNIPAYHPNNCADLALLYFLPNVKGKTKLNILCAFTPQFHGRGPHHFNRRYVWNYNGLIVGKDPVAVDKIGLEITKAKRREKFGKSREMPGNPRYIELADTKHGLGNADLNNIELIKLGWKDGILI